MKKERKRKIFTAVIVTILAIVLITLCIVFMSILNKFANETISLNVNCEKNPYITENYALVSAHRSGGGIFPENTLMAFKDCCESKDFKTDIFEFDLHITKDGVLILLHDDDFDRISNSKEYFKKDKVKPIDKTYEELRHLNLGENYKASDGSYPYKNLKEDKIPNDLRVAKLQDVLNYLISQNKDYKYIIDIKDGGKAGKKATDELYKILKEKGILKNVIVGTFQGEITKYIDKNYSDIIRSASVKEVIEFYLASKTNTPLNQKNIKYDVLQIPKKEYGINLGTSDLINKAHKYNIAVQYWTINSEEDIKDLIDKKADAIITDNPKLAYDIIHSNWPKHSIIGFKFY